MKQVTVLEALEGQLWDKGIVTLGNPLDNKYNVDIIDYIYKEQDRELYCLCRGIEKLNVRWGCRATDILYFFE